MSENKNKRPQGQPKPKESPKPVKESWIGESKSQQDDLRKGSEIPPPTPKKDSKK
jgi:hypothetical protein